MLFLRTRNPRTQEGEQQNDSIKSQLFHVKTPGIQFISMHDFMSCLACMCLRFVGQIEDCMLAWHACNCMACMHRCKMHVYWISCLMSCNACMHVKVAWNLKTWVHEHGPCNAMHVCNSCAHASNFEVCMIASREHSLFCQQLALRAESSKLRKLARLSSSLHGPWKSCMLSIGKRIYGSLQCHACLAHSWALRGALRALTRSCSRSGLIDVQVNTKPSPPPYA